MGELIGSAADAYAYSYIIDSGASETLGDGCRRSGG